MRCVISTSLASRLDNLRSSLGSSECTSTWRWLSSASRRSSSDNFLRAHDTLEIGMQSLRGA